SRLRLFSERRPPPPSSPLFPYTTLFRSRRARLRRRDDRLAAAVDDAGRGRGRLVAAHGAGAAARVAPRFVVAAHTSAAAIAAVRSEEHTSELQSLAYLVCRLLLEKKNNI